MRKEPATNVADTTLVLIPSGTNRGNHWYQKKKKNLGWHYKKGKQQTVEGIQPQSIEVKKLKKTLPKFKKREKGGKTPSRIMKHFTLF